MEWKIKSSDPDTAPFDSSMGTALGLSARTGKFDRSFEVTGDSDIFDDGEYAGLAEVFLPNFKLGLFVEIKPMGDDEGASVVESCSCGDKAKLNLVLEELFPMAAATFPTTIGDMAILFPAGPTRDGGLNEKSSSLIAMLNFFSGVGIFC